MDITKGCVDKNEFTEVVLALREAGHLIGTKPENRTFISANNPEAQKIIRQHVLSGTTQATGYI